MLYLIILKYPDHISDKNLMSPDISL